MTDPFKKHLDELMLCELLCLPARKKCETLLALYLNRHNSLDAMLEELLSPHDMTNIDIETRKAASLVILSELVISLCEQFKSNSSHGEELDTDLSLALMLPGSPRQSNRIDRICSLTHHIDYKADSTFLTIDQLSTSKANNLSQLWHLSNLYTLILNDLKHAKSVTKG